MTTINKKTYTSPTTAVFTINKPQLLNGSIIVDKDDNAHVDTDISGDGYGDVFNSRGDDWDED